jgi:adenylate cyclase
VAGSAFVDVRPGLAPLVMRRRTLLRVAVLAAMASWFVWTVAKLPPLRNPNSEAATGSLLAVLAIVGTLVYGVSAARYWTVFRHRRSFPAVAVIAREWREERFRHLYLPTTRERRQQISVLFGDLVEFTRFAERSTPVKVAAILEAYWGTAVPLITRRFGGELEKFIGDGMLATFNSRGDQPGRHRRIRPARAALGSRSAALHKRFTEPLASFYTEEVVAGGVDRPPGRNNLLASPNSRRGFSTPCEKCCYF